MSQIHAILRRETAKHDVVHNFGRLAFLLPILWSGIRKVQTYMRPVRKRNIQVLNVLGARNLTYTAVSKAIMATGSPGGGDWRTVYNCAPVERYTFVGESLADAPLVFLGRLERCKGAHTAVEVARLSSRRLIIAGNISDVPHEKEYFSRELQPQFDGDQIRYVGTVNDREKNDLLGGAAALLLPVEWEEPFPVVLPEALACGTPVLAFPRGGIPEGILPGKTGFLSTFAEGMAEDAGRVGELSRSSCRAAAVNTYSDRVIAAKYLEIYSGVPRSIL
jgi:glycosyltransferase involved in cell wall biosynthesis